VRSLFRQPVDANHLESAHLRATREFREFATNTVRVGIWLGLWAILFAALGLWLSWHHGRTAAVVITTLAAVAGFGTGTLLPFLWLWVTAPYVQRNEARRAYADATQQQPFPTIFYRNLARGVSFSPNERFRDLLLLRPLVTNREERVVSLSFRMTVARNDAVPRREQPLPPEQPNLLNLQPQHTEEPDLQFRWLGMPFDSDQSRTFEQTYEEGPLAHGLTLTLHIDEHNTGATIHINPFIQYPPPEDSA
jgi:hypothetical protein